MAIEELKEKGIIDPRLTIIIDKEEGKEIQEALDLFTSAFDLEKEKN